MQEHRGGNSRTSSYAALDFICIEASRSSHFPKPQSSLNSLNFFNFFNS